MEIIEVNFTSMWKVIMFICLPNGSQYCKIRLLVVFCKWGGRRGAYISHLSWTPLFQQLAFWLRNFRNNLWRVMVLYIHWDYSSSIENIRGNVCWEDGRVCFCGWLRRTNYCRLITLNRILFCWGGNTQKQAKCRRAAEPDVVLESCTGSYRSYIYQCLTFWWRPDDIWAVFYRSDGRSASQW